jgi:hypothetical protein
MSTMIQVSGFSNLGFFSGSRAISILLEGDSFPKCGVNEGNKKNDPAQEGLDGVEKRVK